MGSKFVKLDYFGVLNKTASQSRLEERVRLYFHFGGSRQTPMNWQRQDMESSITKMDVELKALQMAKEQEKAKLKEEKAKLQKQKEKLTHYAMKDAVLVDAVLLDSSPTQMGGVDATSCTVQEPNPDPGREPQVSGKFTGNNWKTVGGAIAMVALVTVVACVIAVTMTGGWSSSSPHNRHVMRVSLPDSSGRRAGASSTTMQSLPGHLLLLTIDQSSADV